MPHYKDIESIIDGVIAEMSVPTKKVIKKTSKLKPEIERRCINQFWMEFREEYQRRLLARRFPPARYVAYLSSTAEGRRFQLLSLRIPLARAADCSAYFSLYEATAINSLIAKLISFPIEGNPESDKWYGFLKLLPNSNKLIACLMLYLLTEANSSFLEFKDLLDVIRLAPALKPYFKPGLFSDDLNQSFNLALNRAEELYRNSAMNPDNFIPTRDEEVAISETSSSAWKEKVKVHLRNYAGTLCAKKDFASLPFTPDGNAQLAALLRIEIARKYPGSIEDSAAPLLSKHYKTVHPLKDIVQGGAGAMPMEPVVDIKKCSTSYESAY